MTEIIIVGFPKSGNTWLTRLLSDALDYPVAGIDDAIPLAADQQTRNGDGVIRQLHLLPHYNGSARFVENRYTLNGNAYNGQQVIHILRDPRDVAISINAYWGINDLLHTITNIMGNGVFPLWGCGWVEYVKTWSETRVPHLETRYDWLHADPAIEVRRLCDVMGLRIVKPLDEVIRRQSFEAKRAELRGRDDQADYLPHGKGAQLANLRRGQVGDWREAFGPEERSAAHTAFGEWIIRLGYEANNEWLG